MLSGHSFLLLSVFQANDSRRLSFAHPSLRQNNLQNLLLNTSSKNPSVYLFPILNRNQAIQKNPKIKSKKYMTRELVKAILFFFRKKKCRMALHEIFLQPPTLVCSRCINPYFKINVPLFCCPCFSRNVLTPRSESTKW